MPRIPLIDALRGIAIIGVVYHHTLSWRESFPKEGALGILSSGGWHGVNLFFILSGFVLYLPYAMERRSVTDWADAKSFLAHRALRLLPLYYFSTAVLLVFYLQWNVGDWGTYGQIARYLTVTFGFSPSTFYPPVNYVLWSLGVEIWFSVLFPIVVMAVRRYGWTSILVAILLLSMSTRVIGQLIAEGPPRPALNLNFISDSVLGRLDEFALGMWAAHLYRNGHARRFGAAALVVGGGLVFVGMALWKQWMSGYMSTWSAGLFNIPLDIGMVLCLMALLGRMQGVSKLISVWPVQLMGMMCFSLYVWHAVAFLKLRPFVNSTLAYLVYITLTFVISWFTYRYIEFRSVQDWRQLLPSWRRSPGSSEDQALQR